MVRKPRFNNNQKSDGASSKPTQKQGPAARPWGGRGRLREDPAERTVFSDSVAPADGRALLPAKAKEKRRAEECVEQEKNQRSRDQEGTGAQAKKMKGRGERSKILCV